MKNPKLFQVWVGFLTREKRTRREMALWNLHLLLFVDFGWTLPSTPMDREVCHSLPLRKTSRQRDLVEER
jgi:hypothetical protein